jgi:hypothetical protein
MLVMSLRAGWRKKVSGFDRFHSVMTRSEKASQRP